MSSDLIDEPHDAPRVSENCVDLFQSDLDPQGNSGSDIRALDVHEDLKPSGIDSLNGESDGVRLGRKLRSRVLHDKVDSQDNETSEKIPLEISGKPLSDYQSLLANFDDYTANDMHGVMGGNVLNSIGLGFKIGDMVWAKVKSHPWWPGHVFSEAFASNMVLRAKTEGNVLVAFFGDSSYGWFDPEELVHFDPHFTEKSQQMTSRSFTKAVQEAVDEANRRSSLGLACRCRNPYNFRPANVKNHFSVNIIETEPTAIYSGSQIKKARDSFKPGRTIAFVKQLAASSLCGEQRSIEWLKNKATIIAYRKAVYEEFDETYAQAFGLQPVRRSQNPFDVVESHLKEPYGVVLRDLAITDTLGGGKRSTKVKVKEQKKDRYLLKRRDEACNLKTHQIIQGHGNLPFHLETTLNSKDDYVLQNRPTTASTNLQNVIKHEQIIGINKDGDFKAVVSQEKGLLMSHSQELKTAGPNVTVDSASTVNIEFCCDRTIPFSTDISVLTFQDVDDLKQEIPAALEINEGIQQSDQNLPLKSEEHYGHSHSQDVSCSSDVPLPATSKLSRENLKPKVAIDGALKKAKLLKRQDGDLSSGKYILVEKKKKRNKDIDGETAPVHLKKQSVTDKVIQKSIQTGPPPKEDNFQIDTLNGISSSDPTGEKDGNENSKPNLPHLMSDLQSLALDPFYAAERKSPTITKHFFLNFRSLVYQKSLASSLPFEIDPPEDQAPEHLSILGAPPEKVGPLKLPARPDDPTISGRKRGLSDRQKEIAVKKQKKISDLKSLAAEKKASVKAPETQQLGVKETTPLKNLAKPNSVKKIDPPPARREDPTMLIMKFPPQASLPSLMELKARFARFGQLDPTATRAFWNTGTCRVVFRYKVDAEAACKYAMGNNSLFGNSSIRYYTKELVVPGADSSELSEAVQIRDHLPALGILPNQAIQSSARLKSCLKKSTNEEPASVRVTQRVKFMLGCPEGAAGGNRNGNRKEVLSNSNASFTEDVNSRNFQKVIPSSPQPVIMFPQHPKSTNILHCIEAPSSSIIHNVDVSAGLDISQRMLGLLTQCNDVVTNLKDNLGYIPYHIL